MLTVEALVDRLKLLRVGIDIAAHAAQAEIPVERRRIGATGVRSLAIEHRQRQALDSLAAAWRVLLPLCSDYFTPPMPPTPTVSEIRVRRKYVRKKALPPKPSCRRTVLSNHAIPKAAALRPWKFLCEYHRNLEDHLAHEDGAIEFELLSEEKEPTTLEEYDLEDVEPAEISTVIAVDACIRAGFAAALVPRPWSRVRHQHIDAVESDRRLKQRIERKRRLQKQRGDYAEARARRALGMTLGEISELAEAWAKRQAEAKPRFEW